MRVPVEAHPGFHILWTDGKAFESSEPSRYFAATDGSVHRLPSMIEEAFARPER